MQEHTEQRLLHEQVVSGEESLQLVMGPVHKSSQYALAPVPAILWAPAMKGLWWGQDSGALRHWCHKKNSIRCHYWQMQLFPLKIYIVSSASQRAVVSSDEELDKITDICWIHTLGSWMLLGSLVLVHITASWHHYMLLRPFWWSAEAQSTPEIQQGDSSTAGSRASKNLDDHRGFAEHSKDWQGERQNAASHRLLHQLLRRADGPGEPLLRGGLL